MQCEMCKEASAVFHVQQILGEDVYEMHLCRECASKKGISRDGKSYDFSLSKLLTGLLKDVKIPDRSQSESEKCRTCGTKVKDMKDTGHVGCPDCYNTFRSSINSEISLNGSYVFHTGKLPPS